MEVYDIFRLVKSLLRFFASILIYIFWSITRIFAPTDNCVVMAEHYNLIFTTVPCFDHCKILGNMKNDPSSLMLLTVMKNLHGLGYTLQVIF